VLAGKTREVDRWGRTRQSILDVETIGNHAYTCGMYSQGFPAIPYAMMMVAVASMEPQ